MAAWRNPNQIAKVGKESLWCINHLCPLHRNLSLSLSLNDLSINLLWKNVMCFFKPFAWDLKLDDLSCSLYGNHTQSSPSKKWSLPRYAFDHLPKGYPNLKVHIGDIMGCSTCKMSIKQLPSIKDTISLLWSLEEQDNALYKILLEKRKHVMLIHAQRHEPSLAWLALWVRYERTYWTDHDIFLSISFNLNYLLGQYWCLVISSGEVTCCVVQSKCALKLL